MTCFSLWVTICVSAQINGPAEKTAGRTWGLQDTGRGLDTEELELEESRVPRPSARHRARKQKRKLRGISLLHSSPF